MRDERERLEGRDGQKPTCDVYGSTFGKDPISNPPVSLLPPVSRVLLGCPAGLERPLRDLVQFVEIDRVSSALCRLSRLAALGKEFDRTGLSLLFILK